MDQSRTRRAVEFNLRRRRGASEATRARIERSFLEGADLRSQCRHCGHRRFGTMADVTGPCPSCGAGVANTHSD